MGKIDFVISWVDSSDSKWQKKRKKYDSRKLVTSSNGEERFRDYGTLKYLLRSIEKYASWVNKIYLVTDDQKPSWLKDTSKKLVVIDHKEILPKDVLPTFNSNAIEFELDNIPNLSEHFVYFNDDLLINKKVSPRDFFINGLPRDVRIYTRFTPIADFDYIVMNNNTCINQFLNKKLISLKGLFSIHYGVKGNLKNVLQLFKGNGLISNYEFYHNAIPFNKNEFKEAKNKWPTEIGETIKTKFRSKNNVNIYLIRYLRLENGKFIPRSRKIDKYYTLNDADSVVNELKNSKHKLICINDADTSNYKKKKETLISGLNKKFPNKSRFER